jgi:hypothetical protein
MVISASRRSGVAKGQTLLIGLIGSLEDPTAGFSEIVKNAILEGYCILQYDSVQCGRSLLIKLFYPENGEGNNTVIPVFN